LAHNDDLLISHHAPQAGHPVRREGRITHDRLRLLDHPPSRMMTTTRITTTEFYFTTAAV
jgi:hypothetical protein